jgi:hypothetical protein
MFEIEIGQDRTEGTNEKRGGEGAKWTPGFEKLFVVLVDPTTTINLLS